MDIALQQQPDGSFDIALDGADLLADDGLETAVILSLFCDRLANADDPLPGLDDDRRGWWADAFPAVTNDLMGSRQWLLYREKQTGSVLQRAQDYVNEGMQWFLDDGVAESFTAEVSYPALGQIAIAGSLEPPSGPSLTFNYSDIWSAQFNAV